jgi:hypothetical protein
MTSASFPRIDDVDSRLNTARSNACRADPHGAPAPTPTMTNVRATTPLDRLKRSFFAAALNRMLNHQSQTICLRDLGIPTILERDLVVWGKEQGLVRTRQLQSAQHYGCRDLVLQAGRHFVHDNGHFGLPYAFIQWMLQEAIKSRDGSSASDFPTQSSHSLTP